MAVWAGLAGAGEYHVGPTLICSECHILQASNGVPAPDRRNHQPKTRSSNEVCLSCHDGKAGIPDVRGEDANPAHGPRQAGALTTGAPPHEDWKGHTLDSPGPPPGGSWTDAETRLQCASCHAPHGNASYRNLRMGNPCVAALTYATSTTPGNGSDVRIGLPEVPPPGSRVAAGFYSSRTIFFNQVSPASSPYGAFCARCHGDFHGVTKTNPSTPFRRHPTEGVSFPPRYVSLYNSRINRVQVASPGNSAGAAYAGTASPSCMSCHKAHGNRNPFGLIFMRPTGMVTEQGVEGT